MLSTVINNLWVSTSTLNVYNSNLRILTFKGQTQTKRIISEAQLNEEILDRVSNYSYNVTDNHTNRPQFHSQIGGALWLN